MAQIIPKNIIAVESNWQKEIAGSFTDPVELLKYLGLDPANHSQDIQARSLFPMRIPVSFASKMAKQDPLDPLFLQVFPVVDEFHSKIDFVSDPLEEQSTELPGVLHKYQSRVLLMIRGGCAVNCRYCFRRHFPYAQNSVNRKSWQNSLSYIASDTKLNEVIFSGGDPLMAKDDLLSWLSAELEKIPHIKRLRIHTRLPVVIANRISDEFIQWISASKLNTVMILHINHANEIDGLFKQKMRLLKKAGVTLLNQAVLLKDVNDSADSQVALSEALFEADILPYYLHMLDKVDGASHFDISDDIARDLMAEMIRRLPGYLVPKLVREIGGQPGKTPLDLHLHP